MPSTRPVIRTSPTRPPAAASRLELDWYVIGRGISVASSDRATAVASNGPAQIGSSRSPSTSPSTITCRRVAASPLSRRTSKAWVLTSHSDPVARQS